MKITRFSLAIVCGLVLCACAAPATSQPTSTRIVPDTPTFIAQVSTAEPTSVPTLEASATPTHVFVSVSEITSVRSGPSTNFEVVDQLSAGQPYPVIGKSGDWWQIQVDSQTAWVFGGLTELTGDASGIPDQQSLPTLQVLATPADKTEAIASIRKFLGEPGLTLTATELTNMINSPDGNLQVWRYEDAGGRSYFIDAVTNRLVQIDPPPGFGHPSQVLYSATALENEAERLMTENMPEFLDLRAGLVYTANSKSGTIYFFRWDDPNATGFKMNRPFAQVALAVDGTMVSYYNTLGLK